MAHRSVVVLGGGVTGLAAAWELSHRAPDADITVVEGATRTGGKLRRHEVAGHLVDVGAESVLAVRPEATDLMAEVGLGELICHPSGLGAQIYSRGELFPMPKGTVMGVPRDPESVRGLLTDEEVERLRAERIEPVAGDDVAVGDFVEARLGRAVVDRLVEPLLAGVYAGHARRLSLRATVPTLWPKATQATPLVDRDSRAAGGTSSTGGAASGADTPGTQASSPSARPVFAGLTGGLGQLTEVLTERLVQRGVRIVTGVPARCLEVVEGRWRVTGGPVPDPTHWEADALVVATPAASASRMLEPLADEAARLLGGIEYASMAVVTLALRRAEVERAGIAERLRGGTGFLVPPPEELTIKAATFSGAKWGWVDGLDPELVFLRTSIGRAGESRSLQASDDDLVRASLEDLGSVLGASVPEPTGAHVQRWGGALPQYGVGHLDRVARVRSLLASAEVPPVVLTGAAYDGVGIVACVASGRAQAAALLEALVH